MKNKTKTYILLAVVIGVWGIIGYKISNGLSPNVPEIVAQDYEKSFKPKTIAEVERFSIENVERDPFLGTLSRKKSVTTLIVKPKKKTVENAPIITYNGLVKKQHSNKQVFVVNINNKQYLLKQGQEVDSVKLIRGNKKSIVIRYRGKNQTINL